MTTERIKSIGILTTTLVVGIFFGMLIPAFYSKVQRRHSQAKVEHGGRGPEKKGDWFLHTLNRIVEPDSLQQQKMKPITSWATIRLDSIEQSANTQASSVLDSVKFKLHPLVTEAQWIRLEKFDQEAKRKWHHHGRGK